eukprot:UN15087
MIRMSETFSGSLCKFGVGFLFVRVKFIFIVVFHFVFVRFQPWTANA